MMILALAAALAADNWTLTSDVECGNAARIERIGPSRFAVEPREDPVPVEVQKTGPISNYVLYIDITNRSREARELALEVVIPPWLIREKFDYFLRKSYLTRPPDKLEWAELDPARQKNLPDRVEARIDFAPGERKIFSTTEAYPYSEMRRKLQQIARGRAKVREIGKSSEGRPILALETGDRSKPRAVFSATLQPGEPAAWAILAMAEAAAADRELQKRFDLAFVPMTNPDGIVTGHNNVNTKGVIALIGFTAASKGEEAPQEARVLWQYLAQKPPLVFIDFHFLRLPNHPLPRPYVFVPSLWTDTERRSVSETLMRRLEALTGAPKGNEIREDHPLWKNLAIFHAIKNWNTVGTLYQYTGPKTSWQGAQERGVEVMRAALEAVHRN